MIKTPKKIEFDSNTMQANFSAVLYLLTEQQAMIGKLLQTCLDNNLLNAYQLNIITDTQGEEGLAPTYAQLYNRFATYYLSTKELLDENETIDQEIEEAFKLTDDDEQKKDKNND